MSLSTVAGLVPEVRVRGVDDPAAAKLKGDVRMVKVWRGPCVPANGRSVATRRSRSAQACCACVPT